jgi:hypothetical protein
MAKVTGYVVRRKRDGLYYAGTADHEPMWSEEPRRSGLFEFGMAAQARADALAARYQGHAFGVVKRSVIS